MNNLQESVVRLRRVCDQESKTVRCEVRVVCGSRWASDREMGRGAGWGLVGFRSGLRATYSAWVTGLSA